MRPTRALLFSLLPCLLAVLPLPAQQRYTGPVPPQKDMVYLMHADNLVPTEAGEARQESRKDGDTYSVPNPASTARTPLAEPVFLLDSNKLDPNKLALYRLEPNKRGEREIVFAQKRGRSTVRPLRLTVTRLSGSLYRLEAAEPLENGEYSLSPDQSNQVFCFQVY